MSDPISAGIVAGGNEQVTINGVVYQGTAYSTISDSMSANTVTAASDVEGISKFTVSTGKTVALKDTTFSNISTAAPAGVQVGGTFIGENVTFENGSSSGHSGALFSLAGSTVYLNKVYFTGNAASSNSGAMRIRGEFFINEGTFEENVAKVVLAAGSM